MGYKSRPLEGDTRPVDPKAFWLRATITISPERGSDVVDHRFEFPIELNERAIAFSIADRFADLIEEFHRATKKGGD